MAAFADIKTRVHESAKYVRFSGRTFSSKRPLSAILSAKWIAEMKSRRDFASKRILPGHFCEVDLRSFSPLLKPLALAELKLLSNAVAPCVVSYVV